MPITGHRKFGLKDWKSNAEIDVETNWNSSVGENKYLKFTIGKEQVIIENDELRSLLIMLNDLDKATSLMDNKIRTVRYYKVPVTVTLPRNAMRGEKFSSIIEVPITI